MARKIWAAGLCVVLATCARCQDAEERRSNAASAACAHPLLDLMPEQCRASRRVQGSLAGMGSVARKLQCEDGGGLQVFAFGGSISLGTNSWCGSDVEREDGPYAALLEQLRPACDTRENVRTQRCKEATWSHVLEQRLNEVYPCATPHRVRGAFRPGMGSERHLMDLEACAASGYRDVQDTDLQCAHIRDADIIVADTVVNDEDIEGGAEMLARALLRLPQAPSLYWLVAHYKHHFNKEFRAQEPPYAFTKPQERQAMVLQHYNIPQVSVLAAFHGQLHTQDMQTRRKLDFSCDGVHPSAGGHATLAELMLYNFDRDIADAPRDAQRARDLESTRHVLPKPWLRQAAELDAMQVLSLPFTESSIRDVVVRREGFGLREDVAGKPGLIAMDLGASVLFEPSASIPAHGGCAFLLGFLISYEHIGVLEAAVHLPKPGRETEACAAENMDSAPVYTQAFDALREKRFSILEQRKVDFAIPHGVACAWLEVSVVDAPAARTENKAKLLTLGTMCPRHATS